MFLVLAIWMGFGVSRVVSRVMSLPERWALWAHAILVTIFAYLHCRRRSTGPSFDWSDEQALEHGADGYWTCRSPKTPPFWLTAKDCPLEYLHRIEGFSPTCRWWSWELRKSILPTLKGGSPTGRPSTGSFLPGLEVRTICGRWAAGRS
jgi:hypothetical protein